MRATSIPASDRDVDRARLLVDAGWARHRRGYYLRVLRWRPRRASIRRVNARVQETRFEVCIIASMHSTADGRPYRKATVREFTLSELVPVVAPYLRPGAPRAG